MSPILKNYEKGQTTIATFFDLTKAFDCINIEILLDKLDWYGIRGTALDWWRSFLTQRTQYVELQSNIKNNIIFQKSDIKPLKYGIPQGSVAGPLLYIIYVNSILQSNTLKLNTKLVKYADDTSCLVSCKTLQETEIEANITVNSLTQELNKHNLKVNTTKTNMMVFNFNRSTTFEPCVMINGSPLDVIESTKFLGVTIDKHLTWQPHVENLKRKVNSSLFLLKRMTSLSPLETQIQIFHSLIMSQIFYGITIWGNTSDENIKSIFILQKRGIRYIFKIK